MKKLYDGCFAKRFAQMREQSKKNQDTLAGDVGYTQGAIAHWESGLREPSIEVAFNFASYFNVSLDYLLGMSDDELPFDGNIHSTFAERLKDLRIDRDLNQSQLAEKTGLSQSSITAWETGKNYPRIGAFIVLAKYFKVSAEYLFGVDF